VTHPKPGNTGHNVNGGVSATVFTSQIKDNMKNMHGFYTQHYFRPRLPRILNKLSHRRTR
jgi:hypothetical protein